MNTLTQSVITLQTLPTGSIEREDLFAYVYTELEPLTSMIVSQFDRSLNGDLHAAYSEAALVLVKAIDRFEYKQHEFKAFYSRSLKNRLIDMTRSTKATSNLFGNYQSLNPTQENDDCSFSVQMENAGVDALTHYDNYDHTETPQLDALMNHFSAAYPIDGNIIETLIDYSADCFSKKDQTAALAALFGSDTYTMAIQKRVSRARNTFRVFLDDHGYSKSFRI